MTAANHHQILLSYGGHRSISDGIKYGTTSDAESGIQVSDDSEMFYTVYPTTSPADAKRWDASERTGTVKETYTFTSSFVAALHRLQNGWGWPKPSGYATSYSFGADLNVMGPSSFTEYTGAPGSFGSLNMIWVDDTSGWAVGDSVSGNRMYKFNLTTSPNLVNETLLYDGGGTNKTWYFFKRGASIANKIFYIESNAGSTFDIGYINTTDDSLNELLTNVTNLNILAHGNALIGTDDNLYTSRNIPSSAPVLDQRSNADATVITTLTFPTGITSISGIWEAPDGKIWAYVSSSDFKDYMYAVDKSSMTIVAQSDYVSRVRVLTPKGITGGGLFIFQSTSGSDLYYHIMVT